MKRKAFNIAWKALAVALGAAALGLCVNAVSPRGIPLRPMTLRTDYPPRDGQMTDAYITLEKIRAASDIAREAAQLGPEAGIDAPVIIDARSEQEYKAGHIPAAVNIPYSAFLKGRPAALDGIPAGRLLIVYCNDPSCGASVIVAEQLRLYGYGREDVRVFTGGFPEWEKAGLEVAV